MLSTCTSFAPFNVGIGVENKVKVKKLDAAAEAQQESKIGRAALCCAWRGRLDHDLALRGWPDRSRPRG